MSAFNGKDQITECSTPDYGPQFESRNGWIPWAFAGTILFAVRASTTNNTAERAGPVAILYYSPGPIILALAYFLVQSTINACKPGGQFWVDWNLLRDRKIKSKNILGFILFTLISFTSEYL